MFTSLRSAPLKSHTALRRLFHTTLPTLSKYQHSKKITTLDIQAMYRKRSKISMVTAHDYITGKYANDAGVDFVLVGDSLAMVALGYEDTNEIEFDEFLYHCRAVSRGVTSSMIVADMPFGSYESSTQKAIESAIKLISKGRANAVKLEGGKEITPTIEALTRIGIPVVGHVGLTPQRMNSLGGFKIQGRSAKSAMRVLEDALAVQNAGAFTVVLEAVPAKVATLITEKLSVPTIGIGAGPGTSGQVLVQADLLGMLNATPAKFVKQYADNYNTNVDAIRQYIKEVQTEKFPEEDAHTYKIKEEAFEEFVKLSESP